MESPQRPNQAFERLGGKPGIQALMQTFVDRIFDDLMIGFHFRDANRTRVAAMETSLACELFGGPEPYRGKPLDQAHAPHPITGGQFFRRRKILEEVLLEAKVPGDLVQAWLEHTDRLRPLVTQEAGSACLHGLPPHWIEAGSSETE